MFLVVVAGVNWVENENVVCAEYRLVGMRGTLHHRIQLAGNQLLVGLLLNRRDVVEHHRNAAVVAQRRFFAAEELVDHLDHLRESGVAAREVPLVDHHQEFDGLAAFEDRHHLHDVYDFECAANFVFERSGVDDGHLLRVDHVFAHLQEPGFALLRVVAEFEDFFVDCERFLSFLDLLACQLVRKHRLPGPLLAQYKLVGFVSHCVAELVGSHNEAMHQIQLTDNIALVYVLLTCLQ